MKAYVFGMALALAGCTTVERVPGPDGETHLSINCKRSMTNCYQQAAKSCPDGYAIVDKADESRVVSNGGQVVTANRYTMLVKCSVAE
jgi:hypothetical protein